MVFKICWFAKQKIDKADCSRFSLDIVSHFLKVLYLLWFHLGRIGTSTPLPEFLSSFHCYENASYKAFFAFNFNLTEGDQGFRILRAQRMLRQKNIKRTAYQSNFFIFPVQGTLKLSVVWRNRGAGDKQNQEGKLRKTEPNRRPLRWFNSKCHEQ